MSEERVQSEDPIGSEDTGTRNRTRIILTELTLTEVTPHDLMGRLRAKDDPLEFVKGEVTKYNASASAVGRMREVDARHISEDFLIKIANMIYPILERTAHSLHLQ